jgi:hypothetical protein
VKVRGRSGRTSATRAHASAHALEVSRELPLSKILLRRGHEGAGRRVQGWPSWRHFAQGGDGWAAAGIGELDWLRQASAVRGRLVRMLVECGERVVLYGWHREVYSI